MSIKQVVVPGSGLITFQTDEDFVVPNTFPRPNVIIATKSRITITLPSVKDVGASILVVADTRHRVFVNTDPLGRVSGGARERGPSQVRSGSSNLFTSTPSGIWSNGGGAVGPAGPTGPSGTPGEVIQTGFNQLTTDLHFTSNFFASVLSIIGAFTPGNIVQVIANFSCISNDNALPSITVPTLADFVLSVANGAGPDNILTATGTELTFISPNAGESGSILFQFPVVAPNPHTIKLLARIRTAPRSFNINAATEPTREHASLSFLELTA